MRTDDMPIQIQVKLKRILSLLFPPPLSPLSYLNNYQYDVTDCICVGGIARYGRFCILKDVIDLYREQWNAGADKSQDLPSSAGYMSRKQETSIGANDKNPYHKTVLQNAIRHEDKDGAAEQQGLVDYDPPSTV